MGPPIAPEESLRRSGLRVTEARLSILEHLLSTTRHPTAEEVEAAVNGSAPIVSRASVYNVLNTLVEAGLVARVVGDDAQHRYDANLDRHHHLVCSRCGRVEDVPGRLLDVPEVSSLPDGRPVEALTVTLRGLCLKCSGRPPLQGAAGREESGESSGRS